MPDHRIYTSLNRLSELQTYARNIRFSTGKAIHGTLTGLHSSQLRGRGLNFEELRAYRVGDDIRTLDWKVTNRTRKPHVRVYTEERERNVLLLIDQRSHMFFGSRVFMKSVVAAELAALVAWHVLSAKDRIGALIFNDQEVKKVKPQRNQKTAMQILHHVVSFNHQLNAQTNNQNRLQLDNALRAAERLCGHDYLLILVSDMDGWSNETLASIKRIKRHNDLIVSIVSDPIEKTLPTMSEMVVSNGELQIELAAKLRELSDKYTRQYIHQTEALMNDLKKYAIPVWAISTIRPAHEQLQRLSGCEVPTNLKSTVASWSS